MATLFIIGVSIVIAGWLWFYVVRPILEDYGVIEPRVMSGDADFEDADRPLHGDNAPATTTPAISNNRVAITQLDSNLLLQEDARVLAIMVKAGKVGETEGIRLVFSCAPSSSNPKYIAARSALKAELEKLTNPYPQRTPEQRQLREQLGLEKR